MKTILITTTIIAATLLFACQKTEFICTCNTTDSSGATESLTSVTSLPGSHDQAKASCQKLSTTNGTKSTICSM
ncbi:MAG: hypothetical protein RIQ33_20 [Bacteroidota bacterium]|jgi:hypothetical protein